MEVPFQPGRPMNADERREFVDWLIATLRYLAPLAPAARLDDGADWIETDPKLRAEFEAEADAILLWICHTDTNTPWQWEGRWMH